MANRFVSHSDTLIHVATKEYPLNLAAVGRRHVIAFGISVPLTEIQDLGYDVVQDVVPPKGDVVSESFPVQTADGWFRNFEAREFTYAEKQTQLANAKDGAERDRKLAQDTVLAKGVAYDFGGEVGVKHVQVRTQDRTNIVGLGLKALRNPEHTDVFCTAENVIVQLDGAGVSAMSDAAMAGYTAIMAASWTLRDIIAEAETVESLPDLSYMIAELTAAAERLNA